jgi:hypothetical protein
MLSHGPLVAKDLWSVFTLVLVALLALLLLATTTAR